MSSSSWRARGRSRILAIRLSLPCSCFQSLRDPLFARLPGLCRDQLGRPTRFGLFKLFFDGNPCSPPLLLAKELADKLACGSKATFCNLLLDPLFKGHGKRNVHGCSHAVMISPFPVLCQSVPQLDIADRSLRSCPCPCILRLAISST